MSIGEMSLVSGSPRKYIELQISNKILSAVLVLLVSSALMIPPSQGRHGHTRRRGKMSNDEMRLGRGRWTLLQQNINIYWDYFCSELVLIPTAVNTMMEELEDQEDTGNMEVLSPPENMFPHRGSSDSCKLGSKTYCPGEVLFK